MHIFELDRFLSRMVQDCLNSLPTIPSSSSNSASISLQITPQHSTTSQSPPRKSVECLYMTPSANKKSAPIAPHCRSTLDISRRPKSASNAFLPSLHSHSTSRTHKFQRTMHRSEEDIGLAMERDQKRQSLLNLDDTLAVCEELTESEQSQEPIEQLPTITPTNDGVHYATTRIINHKTTENDDYEDELTWPQEPISIVSSTHSYGIKKFVRNSLKLFISQPQHRRTGK